jgi:hypothetical protein
MADIPVTPQLTHIIGLMRWSILNRQALASSLNSARRSVIQLA